MAYPDHSDFNSGSEGSAWWIDNLGGSYTLNETTGHMFATTVQQLLKSKMTGLFDTWDGKITPSREVTVDGKWGPKTLRAIWATLPADVRTNLDAAGRTIQDDDREGKITRASIAAAIWVLYNLGPRHTHLLSGQLYLDPDLVPLPYRALAATPVGPAAHTAIHLTGLPREATREFSSSVGVVPFSSRPGSAEDMLLADEIASGHFVTRADARDFPTPSPVTPVVGGRPTLTTYREPRAITPTQTLPTPTPTPSPHPAPTPVRVTPTTQEKPAEKDYVPYIVVGGTLAVALGVVGYLIYKRNKTTTGQPAKAKV